VTARLIRSWLAAIALIVGLWMVVSVSAHHGQGNHPTFTPTVGGPTNTPVPPTATNTFTPEPPTSTFTPTPIPPTATNTSVPTCQNLVLNPGMEVTGDSWFPRATLSYDTTVFNSGAQSIKINGGGDVYTFQTITLQPSTSYVLTGYLKTENILTTEFGAAIRYTVTQPSLVIYSSIRYKGTTDWTFISVPFTTAANYVGGRVDLHSVSTSGIAWFDDISLTEAQCGTPPTNTPVPPTNTPTNTPIPPTPTATSTPTGGWTDMGTVPVIAALPDKTCTDNTTNPDWTHTISTLTYYDGQLFPGYGDYYCNAPSFIDIIGIDPATGQQTTYATITANANLDMRVVGTQLCVPYSDLSLGTNPAFAFLNADGSVELLNGAARPQAWHGFGCDLFNGKRYVSGSHYRSSTLDGWAIWRDDSGTWIVNGEPNSYYVTNELHQDHRVYGLFVLGDTIYAGRAGTIMQSTTGALGSWSTASAGPTRMKRPMVIGGNAYYGSFDPGFQTGALYRFNGTNQTTLVSSGVWDHTVGTDGNLYYLTSTGAIKNEAGTTVATAPANARSIAFINGAFWVGTSEGRLWKQ
jgi:hypothetical protein